MLGQEEMVMDIDEKGDSRAGKKPELKVEYLEEKKIVTGTKCKKVRWTSY